MDLVYINIKMANNIQRNKYDSQILNKLHLDAINSEIEVNKAGHRLSQKIIIHSKPEIYIEEELPSGPQQDDNLHFSAEIVYGNTESHEHILDVGNCIDSITTLSIQELVEWVQVRLDIIAYSDTYVIDKVAQDTYFEIAKQNNYSDTVDYSECNDSCRLIFRVDDMNYIIDGTGIDTIDDAQITHTQYRRCAGIEDPVKITEPVEVIYKMNNQYHYIFNSADKKVIVLLSRKNSAMKNLEDINYDESDSILGNDTNKYLDEKTKYANPEHEAVEYVYVSDNISPELFAKII